MIRKIEIERFSLTSSKPFDQVVAVLNAAIGHPDMAEFGRSTHEGRSFAELKSAVEKGLSKAGLMLFMQLDQSAVVQKASFDFDVAGQLLRSQPGPQRAADSVLDNYAANPKWRCR